MWWRAGESQSSSPTSDDDGSRGPSNAHSAGGSGGNVRGHSYTEHEESLQQQSQREQLQQQQQQQQFSQHHPHGAGGNPNQEVPFGNLLSPYQQYEQHYPAAVVWGKRPQQPIIQGLARVHQQPSGQIIHGQLSSNLSATGGPPSHYDKLALGSLTSECTSDYAHRSTSLSTPIPSTAPACDSSTTLREAALSANKYGRVFTQGDSAGSPKGTQATVAPPSDDPTQVQDRTRNLSSPGLAVHDARELKIGGVGPMLPRVFPAGESRGRGQWNDGSQGTPFGVTLVEGSAGVPGAPHQYQAPGRLPSVSRLLGNVRNARGPTVAAAGSSSDDQHTRSSWGGGVVGGAVRTTPPDLPPVGGPSPLQQQQHLLPSQQQRPSIIPSSSIGSSQQAQQLYPSLLTHPAAAYMYAPGSPFIGERAPTIPGEVGISSRWEVDESDTRSIRQLPSETYPKRPLPAPSGISSPLIEPTGVAPPAPAAVGMGGNSADIGLGPEQHVAAEVIGIESYHLRQFGGCIVEGCQEPLVVASTSTADAATLVGAPMAIPETRRFCARHIGLSMAYFKRHSSASSETSLPGQQQYFAPYVRGFSFSAPGSAPVSGSDAVSRIQGRTKSTGRSGGGTGTRGGGRCEFPDCTTQPRYATQGSTRPQFCGLHKLPGQVNVVSRCCKHAGCNKVPHFGNNQERPLYCGEHKLEGMVNVANRRCEDPDCQRQPTYGHKGDKRPRFCSTHKQPGMYDVIARRCEVPGCMTRAAFNFQGQKSVKYCAAHKEEGMENLKSKCCEVEGCKKYRVYGFDGEPAVRCASHKREGMVDVRSSRCEFQDCFRHPSFGYKWEKKRRFCGTHKLPDMMDVRSRKQPQQQRGARGAAARGTNPEESMMPIGRGQGRSSATPVTPAAAAVSSKTPAAPATGSSITGESFMFGTGDILHPYPHPVGGAITEPESGQGLWVSTVGQGSHYDPRFPGDNGGSGGGGGASQLTIAPRGIDHSRFGNPNDMTGK